MTGEAGTPLVEATLGPFTKAEATKMSLQFNEEHDGSPGKACPRLHQKLEPVPSL
jgi:hypothetical protein